MKEFRETDAGKNNIEKNSNYEMKNPLFYDSERTEDFMDLSKDNVDNPKELSFDEIRQQDFEKPQWDENELDVDNIEIFSKDIHNIPNNEKEVEKSTIRPLTEQEIQDVQGKTEWPEDKFKKCTIDEDGIIHYKTDRCDLEGKMSENGVPYIRKTIEINGVKIEGVFPKFENAFDTSLKPENHKSKLYAKECNANLKEAIEQSPELGKQFTKDQLDDIQEGRTPKGYVWHHNEEPGKMQLVRREDHDRAIGGAAHTGGSSLWGPDSVEKIKKEGVSF